MTYFFEPCSKMLKLAQPISTQPGTQPALHISMAAVYSEEVSTTCSSDTTSPAVDAARHFEAETPSIIHQCGHSSPLDM